MEVEVNIVHFQFSCLMAQVRPLRLTPCLFDRVFDFHGS